jgi:hypothetical protein
MDANLARAAGRRRKIDRALMNGQWPILVEAMGKEDRDSRYLSFREAIDLFRKRSLPAHMGNVCGAQRRSKGECTILQHSPAPEAHLTAAESVGFYPDSAAATRCMIPPAPASAATCFRPGQTACSPHARCRSQQTQSGVRQAAPIGTVGPS